MNMSPTSPSLIVTSSDNAFALNLVFEAINLQTRAPVEIFALDDGSDAEASRVITSWSSRVRCRVTHLRGTPEQFRRTIALNQAVRAAKGDYLIFLEGDCLPHRCFIEDHVQHAEPGVFVQGRRAGIRARYVRGIRPRHFHPLALFVRRRLYGLRRGLRRPWPYAELDPLRSVDSSNFAAWREDLIKINGFDESFVGWGHEASELVERLRNIGTIPKTVIGQAIVYHLDHRRLPRYRTSINERILARTRREKRTRCEQGLVSVVS